MPGPPRTTSASRRNLNIETLQLFPEPGESGPLHDAHHDFAPRLSATYRLDDDTVVRGGYGHYITQPTMANVSLMFRNPPFNREDVFNTVRTNPTLTLANGFPEGSLAGSTSTPTITTVAQDYGPGTARVWSNQRPAAPDGRVGRGSRLCRFQRTVDLDYAWRYNTPPPGAGAVQGRRPNTAFGDIRVFDTDAEAEYNGLQLRAQNLEFYGA